MTAWLLLPCRNEAPWKPIAPGASFRLPTSIPVTLAVEWQLELHGMVAQDRRGDRPGRDDGLQCQVNDEAPVAEYMTVHPRSTSAYTERRPDRTATTRHPPRRK